jgi:hypothetical protein
MSRLITACLALTLTACTTATQRPAPAQERAALEAPRTPAVAELTPPSQPVAAAPEATAKVVDRPALRTDARVSATAGEEGGVTILWPRIIPSDPQGARTQDALVLQKRLEAVADVELMGYGQDVRPAPERVCPQAGCKGVALGVLLVHNGTGCAAVALISTPGRSATRLVPWVGELTLKKDVVPFREPPESQVVIRDFALCTELAAKLAEREPIIREAVRAAKASK